MIGKFIEKKRLSSQVLFPIGAKLVIIISILLLVSLGAVTVMVSILSTQEVRKTAEDNNFTVNQRAASQAEGSFKSNQAAVLFYLEAVSRIKFISDHDAEMDGYFFSHNQNLAAIGVTEGEEQSLSDFIPNTLFLESNNINVEDVKEYFNQDFQVKEGEFRFYNASPIFQLSLLTIVFIRNTNAGHETIKVLFIPDDLSDSFGTGTNTSFLINSSGDLLLHPDTGLIMGGANFSSVPIVTIMQQEGDTNRQVSYTDNKMKYFGAYYRISGTDLAVITTIPYSIVFEAVQAITRQNIFLTVGVLFIAIFFIWFFSKTISNPIRTLADAALRIEGGDFDIMMESKTRDELGLLMESFRKMSGALGVFGRFTNKDIAVRSMRGEIKPGGLPKNVTIFFSDIRGFTEKSENFVHAFGDKAPGHIVMWLNDYFQHMIQCVEETGGQVDKFIGDGVMAHWGTLNTDRDEAKNAFNCIKAALIMRECLVAINSKRDIDDPTNPPIHIGCGINSGMVTAGQIGSEQRMEYTVIGDAVNVASRIESLNKVFRTDILISEDTWKLTGDKFITEEMPRASLKGKEKPVRVFAVVNTKDALASSGSSEPSEASGSAGPQTLAEVRTLLGIEAPYLNMNAIYNAGDYDSDTMGGRGSWKTSSGRRFSLIEKRYTKHRRQILDRRFLLRNFKAETDAETGPTIIMTSFGSFARINGHVRGGVTGGKTVPITFSWDIHDFTIDTHVIIEVAQDAYFTRIIEKRDLNKAVGEPRPSSQVTINLKEGMYWWRVYPTNGNSQKPATLLYPFGILMAETNAKKK